MIPTSFLDQPIITPFNKDKTPPQETPLKNYLIGQTAFSTVFGFFVCRLPFFQSVALGLATEGCRYVTDKAIEQLSNKFSLIRENKTAVKTALVAGSFFLAKAVVNTVLPGASTLLRAGLLMSTVYLVGEPIARRVSDAYAQGKFKDIKNDISTQYSTAITKIDKLWKMLPFVSNSSDGSNKS